MALTGARAESAQTPLSLSDLNTNAGDPCILDVRVAERLGFERPRVIRELIERNREELETYGEVRRTARQTSVKGGRPTEEFWLNEGQTLLVCMLSRTPQAARVRREVIAVFMAWRRGAVDAPSADLRARVARLEQREDRFLTIIERLSSRSDAATRPQRPASPPSPTRTAPLLAPASSTPTSPAPTSPARTSKTLPRLSGPPGLDDDTRAFIRRRTLELVADAKVEETGVGTRQSWMATIQARVDAERAATADGDGDGDGDAWGVGAFLAARTTQDAGARTQADVLYAAYAAWHRPQIGGTPATRARFGRVLTARGIPKEKEGRIYYRVRLITEERAPRHGNA